VQDGFGGGVVEVKFFGSLKTKGKEMKNGKMSKSTFLIFLFSKKIFSSKSFLFSRLMRLYFWLAFKSTDLFEA